MTSSAFIISTSLTRTNLYTNSNMTPRTFTITNMPMVLSPPEGSPFDIATDNQFVVAKEELNKNDVNNNKEFENSLHTMSTLETRPNSLASTLVRHNPICLLMSIVLYFWFANILRFPLRIS